MSREICDTNVSVGEFGRAKTTALLRDVVEAVETAAASPGPERVHKMRVAIRRLQQSIRLFRQFLRKKGVKGIRTELKTVMDAAGALRNLDIACSLVRRGKGDAAPLTSKRASARGELRTALLALAQADMEARWLRMLGLSNAEKEEQKQAVEA